MQDQLEGLIRGKTFLVTGGTGTVGQGIVRELLRFQPRAVRIYSRDESKQFEMFERLGRDPRVRMLIGDVRDAERLRYAAEEVDIIFHCAAMKHVPACEYNPFEAVMTNVIGTQNVIQAALKEDVRKVIFTGTDKAASPTNTMGATKLLAERIISAANFYKGRHRTVFAGIRFGNIIGSRGSVVLLFKEQIKNGGPVTVTSPHMTRFIMRLQDAVRLVFKATLLARGGEIFTFKMSCIRLMDLAEVMIEGLAHWYHPRPEEVQIKLIGLRPGEKLYEEILTESDSVNTFATEDLFITPAVFEDHAWKNQIHHYPGARKVKVKTYTSEDFTPMTKEELRELLVREGIFKVEIEEALGSHYFAKKDMKKIAELFNSQWTEIV